MLTYSQGSEWFITKTNATIHVSSKYVISNSILPLQLGGYILYDIAGVVEY